MAMPQIDPAIYDQLIGSGADIAQIDPQIQAQQLIAKRLRAMSGAPNQAYMSGRRAVAPNPLEYISGLVNQGVAQQREHQISGMQQKQQGLMYDQTARVLQALKAQKGIQGGPEDISLGY